MNMNMNIKTKYTLALAMTACLTLSTLPAAPAFALNTKQPAMQSSPVSVIHYSNSLARSSAPASITVNKIKFEVVSDADLPATIKSQLDQLKLNRGYKAFPTDSGYLLFISSGEKTSGGYGIEVLSIEDNEGKTNIQVKETSPKPADMTTSVMTYPYVVVRMTGVTDNFNIKNDSGQAFSALTPITVKKAIVKKATGSYTGRIDSNSIEVKINGKPVALQLGKLKKTIDGIKLKKGTKLSLSWQTNEYGQNTLITLKKLKVLNIKTYNNFIEELKAIGYTVKKIKPTEGDKSASLFSVDANYIDVDKNRISVYEFANSNIALSQSKTISKDGSTIGNTKIDWIDTPHFYQKGNLIVGYTGSKNKELLETLEKLLGKSITN